MSNRLEELYKKGFNSIIEILTWNYIYTLLVLCITTDTEYTLINADIMNFMIDNNYIYLYLKNGKFVKGYYNKLDSLSFGLNLNK